MAGSGDSQPMTVSKWMVVGIRKSCLFMGSVFPVKRETGSSAVTRTGKEGWRPEQREGVYQSSRREETERTGREGMLAGQRCGPPCSLGHDVKGTAVSMAVSCSRAPCSCRARCRVAGCVVFLCQSDETNERLGRD